MQEPEDYISSKKTKLSQVVLFRIQLFGNIERCIFGSQVNHLFGFQAFIMIPWKSSSPDDAF